MEKAQSEKLLKKFGSNLKSVREAHGYSQEQLAFIIGFSRSYYVEVEAGKRNISLINICRIVSHLKVEISELLPLDLIKN